MIHNMLNCLLFLFFFFQAEDGIRDLVRSRGLGDVYKRQFLTTRVSYSGTVCFFPADRALHNELLLHSRGVAASGFPPLCNIPHCSLP